MADRALAKLWQSAEKLLKDEMDKPRDQRDLVSVLAKYRKLRPESGSQAARLVQARITFIAEQIREDEEIRMVAAMMADVQRDDMKLAADKGRLRVAKPLPPRESYAVKGLLLPSGLFPGGATGPKRYYLTDADKRVVRAYAQCTTGVVDLGVHARAVVSVSGAAKYDADLKRYIVEVKQLSVIRPAPAAPREPKIQPEPKVEPKPKTEAKPKAEAKPKDEAKPKAEPTSKPADADKPKAEDKPKAQDKPKGDGDDTSADALPDTGLPVVEAPVAGGADDEINRKEYE